MSAIAEVRWITAQVPAELADDFKKLAESHDRSVSAELRRAMKAHVDAHKPARRKSA